MSDHNLLLCTLAPPAHPAAGGAPPALGEPAAPRLRYTDARREEFVAQLEAALASPCWAEAPGSEAASAVASALQAAAIAAFGRPPAPTAAPPLGDARRDAPWFRRCQRAHFNLQDALHRRLDPSEVRRWRNAFNAQKRREMRRLRARRNDHLLRDLRGSPGRFWGALKANGRAAAGGGFTLEEIGEHWSKVLGGAGRGALEEGAAADPVG
ncbi:hypothetical protein MNEG_8909, partial [Monoraphidium neglectum]